MNYFLRLQCHYEVQELQKAACLREGRRRRQDAPQKRLGVVPEHRQFIE